MFGQKRKGVEMSGLPTQHCGDDDSYFQVYRWGIDFLHKQMIASLTSVVPPVIYGRVFVGLKWLAWRNCQWNTVLMVQKSG